MLQDIEQAVRRSMPLLGLLQNREGWTNIPTPHIDAIYASVKLLEID